jgi:hypothetical protein
MRFLSSTSELAKLAALNPMLKTNTALHESVVLPELTVRLKELEDRAKQGVFVP